MEVFDNINQNILIDAKLQISQHTILSKLISLFHCPILNVSLVSFHRKSKSIYEVYHVNDTLEFGNTTDPPS